jgi:hypothetical protein
MPVLAILIAAGSLASIDLAAASHHVVKKPPPVCPHSPRACKR